MRFRGTNVLNVISFGKIIRRLIHFLLVVVATGKDDCLLVAKGLGAVENGPKPNIFRACFLQFIYFIQNMEFVRRRPALGKRTEMSVRTVICPPIIQLTPCQVYSLLNGMEKKASEKIRFVMKFSKHPPI